MSTSQNIYIGVTGKGRTLYHKSVTALREGGIVPLLTAEAVGFAPGAEQYGGRVVRGLTTISPISDVTFEGPLASPSFQELALLLNLGSVQVQFLNIICISGNLMFLLFECFCLQLELQIKIT